MELRLRTKGVKEKEEYGIYFYIRYLGKPYWKHTGYTSEKKFWSETAKTVKSTHPKGKRLKEALWADLVSLQSALSKAEMKNVPYREALNFKKEYISYSKHWEKRLKQLNKAGDLGNYELYAATLADFRKYMERENIDFSDLTYHTLKGYEAYLDSRKLKINTIRLKFRIVKAVWNDAVRTYEEVNGNPFEGLLKNRAKAVTVFKDKHQPLEVLRQLANYRSTDQGKQLASDMWLMAFGLRGAGIIDLIYMDAQNLQDDYYIYDRLKMPKRQIWLKVKMLPWHYDILKPYLEQNSRYIFDLVDVPRNDNTLLPDLKKALGTHQYNRARKNIDNNLKRISTELKLSMPLSMIQARHSWVLLARDLGISKDIIQQAIGHQGQSVMDKHYFGRYDQSLLDGINEQLISEITS